MKTKTRVLAMLLTVLMVVGILPLSLFALDAEEPLDISTSANPGAYTDRTLDEIKTEFAKQNVVLGQYLSFGNLTNDEYVVIREANSAWQAYVNNAEDYDYYGAAGSIAFCDHHKSMSIVDGALYVGNTPGSKEDASKDNYTVPDPEDSTKTITKYHTVEGTFPEGKTPYRNNTETYFQFNPWDPNGDKSQDLYLSVDVKMNGDKMSVPLNGHIFNIVWRGSGPNYIPFLGVNENGDLSVDGEKVGQLSSSEYTRLTLVISRLLNKVYIYVNDVLVNLGGTELISEAALNKFRTEKNNNTVVQSNLPIESVRMYIINDNYEADETHDGVYFDNFTVGKRLVVTTDRTTTDTLHIQSNFAGATHGASVQPYSAQAFGTYDDRLNGGVLHGDAVVYWDEDVTETNPEGDGVVDCIKFRYAEGAIGAYMNIAGAGQDGLNNVSISMKLKKGSDTIKGNSGFVWMRYYDAYNQKTDVNLINLDGNGKMTIGRTNTVLTTLSATEYTELTVEVVSNGANGILLLYYINGALKGIYMDNVGAIKRIESFRLYTLYDTAAQQLKPDDIHMKDIVYKSISKYNCEGPITCFGSQPSGFIERGGVTRYYDGNGGYATEDFFIGTTKYTVGVDGEIIGQVAGVLPQRTLDDVKKAFDEQSINLVGYQTFNSWEMDGDTFAFTANSVEGQDSRENINTYAEYSAAGMQIKNNRNSYYIKKEANGNKSLFFQASTKPSVNYDNFIDVMTGVSDSYTNQQGNSSHDLYLSIDVKMNGRNISPVALVNAVYRPEAYGGANCRAFISLSTTGGIYIGGIDDKTSYNPEDLVGFLSTEEYTRIALATDRANNKLYVYINDVLVNPEGDDLFTQYDVDKMNKTNTRNDVVYTASTVPICNFRLYSSGEHNDTDAHKGIFFDNILVGNRFAVKSNTTEVKTVGYNFAALGQDITIDNPNAELGKAGLAIDPELLVYGSEVIGINDNGEGTIRWVDENGDGKADAAEWHWSNSLGLDPMVAQAYFNLDNPASATTNLRVSIDVKAGQTGTKATTLFYLRNGSTYPTKVTIDGSGNLKLGNAVIGTLSKYKYTNVTLDYVRNTVDGKYAWTMVFVDDVFVGYQRLAVDQNFRVGFIRVTEIFNDSTDSGGNYVANVSNVAEQDIRVKAVSLGSINDYDGFTRMSPFENVLTGFYGIGGVTRYYNGDSTFKTEDFEIDGKKYVVGFGGSVASLESQGEKFAPYAPYTNIERNGTYAINSPTAAVFNGGDNAPYGTIKVERDAQAILTALPDGNRGYFVTRYLDTELGIGSPGDHASYVQLDFGGKKSGDTAVVIDADIMLADTPVGDNESTHSLLYVNGYNGSTRIWGDSTKIFMTGDGRILVDGRQIVKLSTTEFTRLSFVINAPIVSGDTITRQATIDIYVNGVLVVDDLVEDKLKDAKELEYARIYRMTDVDCAAYYKNVYVYESKTPEQFYTMVGGEAVLTSDATKTPAKASDLKQGFISENGVVRYYDELGLPVINDRIIVGDKPYYADENGVVPMPCTDDNHLGMGANGQCSICGAKADGFSALYGASLTVGSDVKVSFLLDYTLEKLGDDGYVEIGLERDFAAGTQKKILFADMTEDDVVVIGGNTYVKVEYALSGKDICSDVTVKSARTEGEYGTEYVYSVLQYQADLAELPEDDTYTAELRALVDALIVYGKNAAAVLNPEAPAAEAIGEVDFSAVSAEGNSDVDGVITLEKISLELKSNIKIKVYYNYDVLAAEELVEDGEYDELSASDYICTVGGNAVTAVKVEELSTEDVEVYVFEYEVVAAALGTNLDFEIMTEDGSGLAANFSALYYAKVMATAGTEAEQNLAKAIKLYADAAAAYAATLAD